MNTTIAIKTSRRMHRIDSTLPSSNIPSPPEYWITS